MLRYIFENYQDSDGRHLDIDFGTGNEHFKLHWSRGNLHPTKSFIMAASQLAWPSFDSIRVAPGSSSLLLALCELSRVH